MTIAQTSDSAAIRARLKHPIIDTDGHLIENTAVVLDYVRQIGGADLAKRYSPGTGRSLTPIDRQDNWTPIGPWWAFPSDSLDRATATLPRLLRERLGELGIDYTILYPSSGLPVVSQPNKELRQVLCRAFNTYYADTYRDYAEYMTPAALIPMHTPEEAVAELEHAVKVLGLKVTVMAGYVRRPVPRALREHPDLPYLAQRLDTFGIDSDYDYDPVWQKCVDLKVAPTFHSVLYDYGSRQSISCFMYNHLGHFAAAGDAVAKSLFFGGVTRRFPTLRFAFLEGGVAWACSMYADMIGRWGKRGVKSIERLDPRRLDLVRMRELLTRYGDEAVQGRLEDTLKGLAAPQPAPGPLDDWARCGVEKPEDIKELFVDRFFIGCEADDPLNTWAFNINVNPLKARMNVIFGSDIGHWDVPDMREVVHEVYELFEHGLINAEELEAFVFTNPVRLHAGMNPDFFNGTSVESAVRPLLRASA